MLRTFKALTLHQDSAFNVAQFLVKSQETSPPRNAYHLPLWHRQAEVVPTRMLVYVRFVREMGNIRKAKTIRPRNYARRFSVILLHVSKQRNMLGHYAVPTDQWLGKCTHPGVGWYMERLRQRLQTSIVHPCSHFVSDHYRA